MVRAARLGNTAGRFLSGVTIVACAATTAHANVEIGGFAGAHLFDDKSELGAADGPNAPSQRSSALAGVRVGLFAAGVIGIEAEVGVIPTVARTWDYGVTDVTYRAHLVFQLPGHAVVPFLLAGAGGFTVAQTNDGAFKGDPLRDIAYDTDVGFYGGIGAKLQLGRSAGLRLDVRALAMPSSENTVPPDLNSRALVLDLEAFASVYYEVGRGAPPPATAPHPQPPELAPDLDGDGVRGSADKCPHIPEDKDGFADDDGCPDPDNDGDGVPDASDDCPFDAEDKDGFADADGCPDPDNDGDGVPDGTDACPVEPEDRDGFADDDGCPDPDNDGDGVLDAKDRCPDQLETKNGFADTDGCPDTIPPEVQLVNGVLPKLAFKPDAATLAPGATKTLDAVVVVLVKHDDLHVAIGAHTDDTVLMRGLFADNQELSQARAETVMAYLVGKGIDASRLTARGYADTQPRVPPAGLTGTKLANARAANRRVELHLVSPLP